MWERSFILKKNNAIARHMIAIRYRAPLAGKNIQVRCGNIKFARQPIRNNISRRL